MERWWEVAVVVGEEEEVVVGGVEGGKVGRWKMGFLAERVGMAIGI